MVARAGETLDTMLAGAIVGAVTGAAKNLAHEPTAMPLCNETGADEHLAAAGEKPTISQVLEEMAPGAAVGAMSGTAKAVVTKTQETKETGGKKKSRS